MFVHFRVYSWFHGWKKFVTTKLHEDTRIECPCAIMLLVVMDEEPQSDQPVFRDTLSKMSHEMRTPLTSIMGFSELLLEDESITGQPREYLQIISDESRRMSEMLDLYVSVLRAERENED